MKSKKQLLIVLFISLVSLAVVTSFTLASFKSKDTILNHFSIGDLQLEIKEDWTEPASWHGEVVKKVAWVENTDTFPEIIRVAIEPRFEDKNGNFFSGNTNYIQFNYDNITTDINEPNKWFDGGDGYYYYTSVVKTTEKTTDIINSLKYVGPDSEKQNYYGLSLKAVVRAEGLFSKVQSWKTDWTIDQNNTMLVSLLQKLNNE